MKILLIEDEQGFVEKMQHLAQAENGGFEIVVPTDVGLRDTYDEEGTAVEEQLLARVKKICESKGTNLVMLDTDLSQIRNGIGQTAYRQAFQTLGMPVCRYTKRQSQTAISKFEGVMRLANDGTTAIWIPGAMVKGDLETTGIVNWLLAVNEGFEELLKALTPELLGQSLGPAGILARALGRSSANSDFLGYTAQNFFFFAPAANVDGLKAEKDPRKQSTRLGYWLFNYILAFPGPILNANATAAFLNLTVDSFKNEVVQSLIENAKYSGPFHKLDAYYWREDLLKILDKFGGDIVTAQSLEGVALERVDKDNPGSSAFLCVLTDKPIAASSAAPQPDWIPAGAQLTRIGQDIYDELGPMLSV